MMKGWRCEIVILNAMGWSGELKSMGPSRLLKESLR